MTFSIDIILEELYNLQRLGIKVGLEHTVQLLNEIGNPHKKLRLIHIAGTNGKGSITAFLESILFEANKKFGVTTSPHLFDICERIRVNKQNIQKNEFEKFISLIDKKFSGYKLTFDLTNIFSL